MNKEEMLQRDVVAELAWDPRVDSSHIAVTVDNSIAVLEGRVTTYPEKLAAEASARRVRGIWGVVDNLEVRLVQPFMRSDEAIARSAMNALRDNVAVPPDCIKVTVDNGFITLDGEVPWRFQADAAKNAVRFLFGVVGVHSRIIIKQPVKADDIRDKLEQAFNRSAEIDASQVEVDVDDTVVTLRGLVQSWAESEAAERVAWSAPGVTKVKNELVVESAVFAGT